MDKIDKKERVLDSLDHLSTGIRTQTPSGRLIIIGADAQMFCCKYKQNLGILSAGLDIEDGWMDGQWHVILTQV